MSVAKETDDVQLLPCSFQFHDFHDQVGEVRLVCQMMKMDNSLYMWISDYNEPNMKDLSLAFTIDNEPNKPVVSTKIMGPVVDETSINIANKLSKKTGKPIYVSFNANADNLTLPNIERRIYEEFKNHPELLEL
ncbi:uncharacterized protein LOC131671063 [Phymastichus coffea]|uniref:uncharacterized protein LOC131671063 n=1 Tax=Phymastichus coffea TaxID=108790 RepID=UPI00273A7F8A|nr:uncharacterized protein LOC131671063 [Phymastichus coffea]